MPDEELDTISLEDIQRAVSDGQLDDVHPLSIEGATHMRIGVHQGPKGFTPKGCRLLYTTTAEKMRSLGWEAPLDDEKPVTVVTAPPTPTTPTIKMELPPAKNNAPGT